LSKKTKIDGCNKIFRFLQLLYEDNADYNRVLEIFKDDLEKENYEKNPNGLHVALNKYTNTLKVFGIKVEKHKSKYRLKSCLYSLDLTLEDIKALSIFASFVNEFPDKDLSESISEFLEKINLRMNNEDKNTYDNLTIDKSYDFAFKYLDSKEQIEQCQKLCKDGRLTKITYLKNYKPYNSFFIPKEVLFGSKYAYLLAYDTKKKQNVELALPNILLIENTPQIQNQNTRGLTVVYKLKNRLAKNYKYKEGEYLSETLSDGSIIVVNKNESPENLMNRLLRYASDCEIMTPVGMRYEFLDLVNETLNNYND